MASDPQQSEPSSPTNMSATPPMQQPVDDELQTLRDDFKRYLELGFNPLFEKLNMPIDADTERLFAAIIEANMLSVTAYADRRADKRVEEALTAKWYPCKDIMPPYGELVVCRFEYFNKKFEPSYAVLKHVDEDDVCWRTADDDSEFNEMNATVTHWQTLNQYGRATHHPKGGSND